MKRVLSVAVGVVCLILTFVSGAFAATPTPPFDTNLECLQCHDLAAGSGAFTTVDFTVGAVDYAACAMCHGALEMTTVHAHTFTTGCEQCHNDDGIAASLPSGAPSPIPPRASTAYGTFESMASLTVTAQELHRIHGGSSWVENNLSAWSPTCSNCHAAATCTACHMQLVGHADHAAPRYPGVTLKQATGIAVTNEPLMCVNVACHSVASPGSASFTAPTCANCHPTRITTHGYESVDHVADDATLTPDATSAVGPSLPCSQCHALDLLTEHEKMTSASAGGSCATCHPTPRNSYGAWDQSCSTGECHKAGSATQPHTTTAASHSAPTSGNAVVCGDCHSGGLAVVHAGAVSTTTPTISGCAVCHTGAAAPSTNDCTQCHFTFDQHYEAAKHQSSWTLANCAGAGCHASQDLNTVHNEHRTAAEGEFTCQGCHGSTDAAVKSAVAAGLTGCGDCHAGVTQDTGHRAAHWSNPLLVGVTGPAYSYYLGSAGTTPVNECSGCHVSNMIDEHMGQLDAATGNILRLPRTDSAGDPLGCPTCHNSSDVNVLTAIATGDSRCESCHAVHGPVSNAHASSFMSTPPVDCSAGGCHSSQLEIEHSDAATITVSGTTLRGCDLCHANTEGARGATVQTAISVTNDTQCTACHDGLMAAHPDFGSHTASTAESLGCGVCHAAGATTSIDVKAVHQNAAAGTCAVCHSSGSRLGDITLKTGECASCHSTEGTDYHAALPAAHTYAAMDASCSSGGCHTANTLPEVHQAHVDASPEDETTCSVCHANPDSSRIPVTATAACDSCHASIHANMDHTGDVSADCIACHETNDVTVVHANAVAGPCTVCHGNAVIATLPVTADCINCHAATAPVGTAHYPAVSHTATDGMEGTLACSQCHSLDMKADHATVTCVTCVTCHETKVDGFTAAWDKQCSACHATKHTNKAASHTSANASCTGSSCHVVTDVATLHANSASSCAACHAPGVTAATDCATAGCHPVNPHVLVEPNQACAKSGCHGPGSSRIHGEAHHRDVACTKCHGQSADGCVQSGCHGFTSVHRESAHTVGGCVTCHPSGIQKPHSTIQTKMAIGTSWSTVCGSCHGSTHRNGTDCGSCHTSSRLHSESAHRRSTATCAKCHVVTPDDLTLSCTMCHQVGSATITSAYSDTTTYQYRH